MNTLAEPAPPARLAHGVSDFAKLTGIPQSSIWAAIRAGDLRARKFGRRTLILADDGRAFLDALPARETHPSN